jgi:uncharacterized protein YbaR (Trm112 family)
MPASDSLFCFTSNKLEIHACPDCRAPMMLVRRNIGTLGLERTDIRSPKRGVLPRLPGDMR